MIIIKNKAINIGLLIILIIVVPNLFSCQLRKAMKAALSEDLKPQYVEYKDKAIIFAPLVHFGKPLFYAKLTDSIKSWKKDGYIVFYEAIIHKPELMNVDSAKADTLMRQFRRMMGGDLPSLELYATLKEVKMFKNNIVQPAYTDLGIDSSDVNADVSIRDLVFKYEELYEPVIVDSCDFSIPITSTANCGKKLRHKLDPVLVDYRNQEVVNSIKSTDSKKIVVLYGAAHIKGMKKLLKEKRSNKK